MTEQETKTDCLKCVNAVREYQGPWCCNLTAKTITRENRNEDCVNFEKKEG